MISIKYVTVTIIVKTNHNSDMNNSLEAISNLYLKSNEKGFKLKINRNKILK